MAPQDLRIRVRCGRKVIAVVEEGRRGSLTIHAHKRSTSMRGHWFTMHGQKWDRGQLVEASTILLEVLDVDCPVHGVNGHTLIAEAVFRAIGLAQHKAADVPVALVARED